MIFAVYVLVSAIGGLLVGVLGTGSALVLLPALTLIFDLSLADSDPLRLAAGTTMAVIAVGAISGALAQYRHGQVDPKLLRIMVLPYVVGGLAGPWISRLLPSSALGVYVAIVITLIAVPMLLDRHPPGRSARDFKSHRLEMSAVLLVIGAASSVAGIASGVFAIPYLARFDLPIRTVIGTSTAAAAVYATSGAAGYIAAGWSAPARPALAAGYVYLPAFLVMAATALVATPLAVRLAGRISERRLRKAFAVFLLVAAVTMLV